MHEAYRLGASLYVPATNPRLGAVFAGTQLPAVRSLIACTEDAIADTELTRALALLREMLPRLPPRSVGPLRFVRPRNALVLGELLAMPGIERVHGFVLPKADTETLPAYEKLLAGRDFWVMPTLETAEVFDVLGQRDLRLHLQKSPVRERILTLRIGGNDLLRMLVLKRTRGTTIYETPIGALIQQLVLGFRPYGFQLAAPVYDFIDDPETLRRETQADIAMGLVGKTAIHPDQVPVIERALAVSQDDLRAAREILATDAAVFRFGGAMLEKNVHTPWARSILAREVAGS